MNDKPPVKVTRADVYAAQARVLLDKQLGREGETPEWVKRLAKVALR